MKFKWRIAAAVSVAMTATVATAPFAETVKAAEVTDFGMAASGFVSQVVGGELPANSGRTASSIVACTRTVPIEHSNSLTTLDLGGVITVEGGSTNNSTQQANGKPASISRTEIADVFVGPDALTQLHLEALVVETRTWHASDGFHRKTSLDIEGLSLVLAGLPVSIPLDNFLEGTPVIIPGIAEIQVGSATGSTTAHSSRSQRTLLEIELLGLGGDPVEIMIGRAASNISDGFTGGVLNGTANAVTGTVAGGLLTVGPVAPKKMPCKGTAGGAWSENAVATFNVPLVVSGGVAASRVAGLQGDNSAIGRAQSEVASATFAGELVITGVKSNVYVRKNANGTFVKNVTFDPLSITLAGTPIELPDPGVPHRDSRASARSPSGTSGQGPMASWRSP